MTTKSQDIQKLANELAVLDKDLNKIQLLEAKDIFTLLKMKNVDGPDYSEIVIKDDFKPILLAAYTKHIEEEKRLILKNMEMVLNPPTLINNGWFTITGDYDLPISETNLELILRDKDMRRPNSRMVVRFNGSEDEKKNIVKLASHYREIPLTFPIDDNEF